MLCRILLIIVLFIGSGNLRAAEFSDAELIYMPATIQIELFEEGLLTPREVVEAQIREFEKTNKVINAATYTHFEKAREQADIAAERYRNRTNRPLEGITIGLKDEHFVKGMVVTQGSLIYKDSEPKESTDEMTQKLLDAGGIILMQTTVPEFYLSFVVNTRAWGVTRNPWNNKYSVGGSSGGSAAALAAGYVTLATGSDMAGSIRIPAALNGVYGYKPPFGEVYTELPFSYFSGSGALARNFADLVLMRNVIAGQTPDSLNVRPYVRFPQEYKGLEGLRIAYVGGMGVFPPTSDTQKQIDKALAVLRGEGAIVDAVKVDLNIEPSALARSVSEIALSGSMSALFTGYGDKLDMMTGYAAGFVQNAINGEFNREKLARSEEMVKELYKRLAKDTFNKGYDIILTPTLITSNIPAEMDAMNDILVEDGKTLPSFCGVMYTIPFNLLNWMPVISVPVGLNSNNMPVGMQIVGKPGDSLSVFRVASWYSKRAAKMNFEDKE